MLHLHGCIGGASRFSFCILLGLKRREVWSFVLCFVLTAVPSRRNYRFFYLARSILYQLREKRYSIKLVIINRDSQRIFCDIYLTITKSREIFVIFLEASIISSTRCSLSISVFVFPIPCILVGSTAEKIRDIYNTMKLGFMKNKTL